MIRTSAIALILLVSPAYAEQPLSSEERDYLLGEYCRVDFGIAPGSQLDPGQRNAIKGCKFKLFAAFASACFDSSKDKPNEYAECMDLFIRDLRPEPWIASRPKEPE